MSLSAFKLPIVAALLALLYFAMSTELNDARKLGSQNQFYTGELAEVARLERELLIFINTADNFVAGNHGVKKDEVLLAFDLFWARVNTTHTKRFITRIDELRKYEPFIIELAAVLKDIDPAVQALTPGDKAGLARIRTTIQPYVPTASHFTTTAFAELQRYSLRQTELQRSAMNGLYKVQLGFLLVAAATFSILFYQLERGKQLLASLRKREHEISLLATTDHLTGLHNRREFEARLSAVDSDFSTRQYSLLLIDLDGFKIINDTHGHTTGDNVLREAAARFKAVTGEHETLARLGGDEFALLMTGPHAETAQRASDIVSAMERPFEVAGNRISLGASVGIATKRAGDGTAMQMMHDADVALYRAKRNGRSQFFHFSEELASLAADIQAPKQNFPSSPEAKTA